jgi:NAD(P)-dependent dehydrogenase (short-subunit alcohol dehydrogenase family)
LLGTFTGKVALITDTARGQGRSHAIALAEQGADMIVGDIREQIGSVPYEMGAFEDLAQTKNAIEAYCSLASPGPRRMAPDPVRMGHTRSIHA